MRTSSFVDSTSADQAGLTFVALLGVDLHRISPQTFRSLAAHVARSIYHIDWRCGGYRSTIYSALEVRPSRAARSLERPAKSWQTSLRQPVKYDFRASAQLRCHLDRSWRQWVPIGHQSRPRSTCEIRSPEAWRHRPVPTMMRAGSPRARQRAAVNTACSVQSPVRSLATSAAVANAVEKSFAVTYWFTNRSMATASAQGSFDARDRVGQLANPRIITLNHRRRILSASLGGSSRGGDSTFGSTRVTVMMAVRSFSRVSC